MELTFYRVRTSDVGFGRMGLDLATAMRSRPDLTVYDEIAENPRACKPSDRAIYLPFGPKPSAGLSDVVLWASVAPHVQGWYEGQTPVLWTMFEANTLPPALSENLDQFDTVIVPSVQNQEMFSAYHGNVKYVPLGVDPVRWSYVEREPRDRFNFLVCGLGLRKGLDLAYKAFHEVFPEGSWGDGPEPWLTIKSTGGEGWSEPRVEVIIGHLPIESEVELYAEAHCFLAPARGEGFGLQPLQAMAQGCPTILTNAHGHAAFAQLGWPISAPKMVDAGDFLYGDGGQWWEPDFDEFCYSMRWIYDNYTKAADRAKESATFVAEHLSWERSVDRLLDAIGRERLGSYEGPKTWHAISPRLHKMVLNCDWHADIGGYISPFVRGTTYWVPADIKRQCFNAGSLDVLASCMPIFASEEGEPGWDAEVEGLLPEQMARLPRLWRERINCPACHQSLVAERERDEAQELVVYLDDKLKEKA